MDDTQARTVPAMTAPLAPIGFGKNKIPKLIMIDHVQLMAGMNRKNQDRRLEIEDISNSCKHMAREFKATVILLSQLNRACEIENRRPQLSDSFAQRADRWNRTRRMLCFSCIGPRSLRQEPRP